MSWRISAGLSLLAAVVFCASAPRASDEFKSAPLPQLVAVVDYDSLFQKNPRYKAALENLKNDTTKLDMEFKTENESVQKLEEELKALQPGSPEFLNRREEAALKKHQLRARIELARAKIDERRVQVEVQLMNEYDETIKKIAVTNNIALVLNQDSREQPARDLEATQRQRQRRVIYHNPVIDITPLVFNKIN